jgi:hypothetical protein
MNTPSEFKKSDIIDDFYTGDHYKVIDSDKHGMAVLLNLGTRKNEVWNSCNNCRFTKLEGQLELFK